MELKFNAVLLVMVLVTYPYRTVSMKWDFIGNRGSKVTDCSPRDVWAFLGESPRNAYNYITNAYNYITNAYN